MTNSCQRTLLKSPLNQYAISQVLGSKMRPVKEAGFGNLLLLETTAEGLRAFENNRHFSSLHGFGYTQDAVVVQAFEDVRQGVAPDVILCDTNLAHAFCTRCRELGLDAPDEFLCRRLLNVRKDKARFAKHGIHIKPSTVKEKHPSILPEFAHTIEFALVRLRFRHGVSIDDILLDPRLRRRV